MTDINNLDQKIGKNPSSPWLYYDRGIAYMRVSLSKEALRDFNQAISLDPTISDFYVKRGQLLTSINRMSDAKLDFDRAIALDPFMDYAYSRRAAPEYQRRQYEAAADDIRRAILLDPTEPYHYHFKAMIYSALRRPAESLEAISRAIELQPNNPLFFKFRFNLYIYDLVHCGIETVWTDAERAIQLSGGGSGVLFGRGLMYFAEGRWEEAAADFAKAYADKNMTWSHARSVAFLLLSKQQLGIPSSQVPEVSDVLNATKMPFEGPAIYFWPIQGVAMLSGVINANAMIDDLLSCIDADEPEMNACLFETYLYCVLRDYFCKSDIESNVKRISKFKQCCNVGFYHEMFENIVAFSLPRL